MKRIEVILSAAIEEDFINACESNKIVAYTKIVNVVGTGNSVPKQGDSVWPQFNSLFILYCEEEKVESLKKFIDDLRSEYPTEGVACFISVEDYLSY